MVVIKNIWIADHTVAKRALYLELSNPHVAIGSRLTAIKINFKRKKIPEISFK